MLKKNFSIPTETTTYPVVRDWYDLDDEQNRRVTHKVMMKTTPSFGLLMVLPSHLRATYTPTGCLRVLQ